MRSLAVVSVAIALCLSACTGSSKKQLWVYTSSYKEAVALYQEALAKEFPELEIKWFQSGSENVAAKITAEMAGGEAQADLMMTSDLFFFEQLKQQNALKPIEDTPALAVLPKEYFADQRMYVVNRFPVMVVAYNKDKMPASELPKTWKQLLDPKYKGKLSMPSPLESGTALTTILFFKNMFGESYFEGLRKNEILASGGNGSVMARIQSGEKPIGIVLMENVLQAKDRGLQSVEFLIPEEGALPMPSCLAIFKTTREPVWAQKVADWILTSPRGQEILKKSYVYSALPQSEPPIGGPLRSDIKWKDWNMSQFVQWGSERQAIKESFQKIVLK